MGWPSEKKLARLISARAGYIDPELAEDYYHGLVKAITHELRTSGYIFLPGIGKIYLQIRNPRSMKANRSYWHFKTDGVHALPERRYVKFKPSPQLSAYVRDFMKITEEADKRGRSVSQ